MAISIQSTPSGGESVQDTLWHVASSTNSAIPDFKYVFDIWISATQKIRVKQYPNPSTNYGYFDAGPIVRNSFSYDWFNPSPSIESHEAIIEKEYDVRYGEEYSGSTYLNLASGSVRVYNWRPDLFRRKVETPIADYQYKFVTERNHTFYADFTKSLFVGIITNGSINIKYYDANNDMVGSSSITPGFPYSQLNLYVTFDNALYANAKYVEVISEAGSGDRLFIYNKCNSKYETIPIHFLNRFGFWESIHFDLVSRLIMDVERKGFEKRDFSINGSNVNYYDDNNVYVESKINYSNKMNWSYRLTADAMNDVDYQWASQLIDSPQILMEIDDYFYPVTIKNTNYEYSKYVNNRQRALEIDFEMNQTRYSHLR